MDTKANNIGYASLRSYNNNPKMTTNNDMVIKPSFSASAGYNTGYWKSNNVNVKQFGYGTITKAYNSCDMGGCTSAKLKALL